MRRAFLTLLAAFICSILGYFNYEVNAHSVTQPTADPAKSGDTMSGEKSNKKVSKKSKNVDNDIKKEPKTEKKEKK